MIVVLTPTGSIGSKLIPLLLGANEKVRVVARDPAKLGADVTSRVDVVQGSSDDEAVLARAFDGADAVFHVVPPYFATPDVKAHYFAFTRPVITAMKQKGVTRIVTVSALGRHSDLRAGVVSAALDKDVELERAGLDVRALWCPGFMENMLRAVDLIRTQGMFAEPRRGDVKAPYAATRDIAATAARLLRDRSWRGPGGVAVLGPEDLSCDDIARITGKVLGRPVRFQSVPADAWKAQMLQYGASPAMADGLLEMYAAKDAGLDSTEPRTPESTTPTSYRQWCTEVLKPAIG